MKELLQSIKEQLFDAPSDIKSAFNNIVEYFSDEDFTVKGIDPSKLKSGDKVILDKYFKKDGKWEKPASGYDYNLGPNTIRSIEKDGERFIVKLEADYLSKGKGNPYHPKTRIIVDNNGVTKTAYTESTRIPYRYVITK